MKCRYIPLISYFIFFVNTSSILAQKNAGVIPYFKNGDQIFILIADHRESDRGWASFGGRRHNNETNEQTAAREFHEETKTIFKDQNILKRIKNSPKIEQENFVSFVVEVDFVSVYEIINMSIEDDEYNERGPYVWIPLPEILRAIKTEINGEFLLLKKYLPKDYQQNKLYKPFVQTMKNLEEDKVLEFFQQVSEGASEIVKIGFR